MGLNQFRLARTKYPLGAVCTTHLKRRASRCGSNSSTSYIRDCKSGSQLMALRRCWKAAHRWLPIGRYAGEIVLFKGGGWPYHSNVNELYTASWEWPWSGSLSNWHRASLRLWFGMLQVGVRRRAGIYIYTYIMHFAVVQFSSGTSCFCFFVNRAEADDSIFRC